MNGWLEISLGALARNARALRALTAPRPAAFVVKSNAYGHGLVPAANAIAGFADRLCVYTLDEGLALRAAGIELPVLVLGPVPSEGIEEAVAASLELALWDAGAFAARLAAAARRRERRTGVHVKINTGLNRLGLEPHELSGALESLAQTPEIGLDGIFSHLAAAEEIDSPYTMHQLNVFERALAGVEPLLARDRPPLRHIAASAAAMVWPQTRLDMARFGIALYGLWPSPQTRAASGERTLELEPALTYRSRLIVVREVDAGGSVGYGGTFHAPRAMRVGVVPAGYGDGIPRALSNRGAFAIDGVLCPIVGRVAMNMTEIDVTNAPGAHAGSEVTLIGRSSGARVTADDWAGWADTINYEIVARLPETIVREYVP